MNRCNASKTLHTDAMIDEASVIDDVIPVCAMAPTIVIDNGVGMTAKLYEYLSSVLESRLKESKEIVAIGLSGRV